MDEGTLFLAVMYNDYGILNEALLEIEKHFGVVFFKIRDYDFKFTDYYNDEFGSNLKKTIFVLDSKIKKEDLVEIKILCTQIEGEFSQDGKRSVNIDPGYFNGKEAVLASFKNKDFKEDLGDAIFAHKVLEFDGSKARDFFHTFADFKSKDAHDFFLNIKALYY